MPVSHSIDTEIRIGILTFGLVVFVYIGSYLVMLDGAAPAVYYNQFGEPVWFDETQYRWGGEVARWIFYPINWIDRKVRPWYWGV